jgi:hypothetical protein
MLLGLSPLFFLSPFFFFSLKLSGQLRFSFFLFLFLFSPLAFPQCCQIPIFFSAFCCVWILPFPFSSIVPLIERTTFLLYSFNLLLVLEVV